MMQVKNLLSAGALVAGALLLSVPSLPDRVEDGEQRWQTFGITEGILLLMVAHTTKEMTEETTSIEVVRVITARPATRKERRRYEDENG